MSVNNQIKKGLEFKEEDILKFLDVLFEWGIEPDYFVNLHEVCDPNQALIDAFKLEAKMDCEDGMALVVEFCNGFCQKWDDYIKLKKEGVPAAISASAAEITFKRESGKQVRIYVALRERRNGVYEYIVNVDYREAGKRLWISADDVTNDYKFRSLPMNNDSREKYILEKQLEHVTFAEIHQAKLKAWESLKPKYQ